MRGNVQLQQVARQGSCITWSRVLTNVPIKRVYGETPSLETMLWTRRVPQTPRRNSDTSPVRTDRTSNSPRESQWTNYGRRKKFPTPRSTRRVPATCIREMGPRKNSGSCPLQKASLWSRCRHSSRCCCGSPPKRGSPRLLTNDVPHSTH